MRQHRAAAAAALIGLDCDKGGAEDATSYPHPFLYCLPSLPPLPHWQAINEEGYGNPLHLATA